jgi:trimeric autotransporter adhesin
MRRILLLTAAAACGLFLFYRVVKSHKMDPMIGKVSVDKMGKEQNEDGIREAMEMEFEATKDVSLGYVPKNRLTVAVNNLIKQRRHGASRMEKTNAFTWTERGPNTDVTGPSTTNPRPGNGATSGRIRAIWVDLADATSKTVWIGGVDGGIWKTTDITSPTPNWSLVNDFFGNLAIGSICQNPANLNEMYFGTGEKAQSSFFVVQGGGIWKSTDHGLNWNLLPSTTTFFNVSKVLCDASGNLYVSAIPSLFGLGSTGGVFRSSDGGNT